MNETKISGKFAIYLISLTQDIERRERLKVRFPEEFFSFQHIEAVDGRTLPAKEYFEKIYPFYQKHKRIMSPAELGCTLSHIKALEKFLAGDEQFALIIEDDVIGDDEDIDFIKKFTSKNVSDGIVFCGCQDGLLNRYKYGKPMSEYALHVSKSNRGMFSRTAAYVVSRSAAQCIIGFHRERYINVADFWFDILGGFKGDVYYISKLSHPLDLSFSSIEGERLNVQRKVLQKIFSRNFFNLILARFFNEIKRVLFKVRGHIGIESMR